MAINARKLSSEITKHVRAEGNPKVSVAPVGPKDLPAGLPDAWVKVLTAADPRKAVLDLWKPVEKQVPKVLRAMKKKLQGVGLLTTQKRPPSLLYIFTEMEEELLPWRGFLPRPVDSPHAAKLPKEFLDFYQVHDGWVFVFGESMGPRPSSDWKTLENDPTSPAGQFLVVYTDGGGGTFGFDLRKPKPPAYVVWPEDKPKAVADVWEELDDWIKEKLSPFDNA